MKPLKVKCLKCDGLIAGPGISDDYRGEWCYCDKPQRPEPKPLPVEVPKPKKTKRNKPNETYVTQKIVKYFGEKALQNEAFVKFCMDAYEGSANPNKFFGNVPPKPDVKLTRRGRKR